MRSRGRGFHGHWIRGVAGPGPRVFATKEVSSARPVDEVNAAEVSHLPALPAPDGQALPTTVDVAEDEMGLVVEAGASNSVEGQYGGRGNGGLDRGGRARRRREHRKGHAQRGSVRVDVPTPDDDAVQGECGGARASSGSDR